MIAFCFHCNGMRSTKTCEGWIIDRQIKHERCETCRYACGPTLNALLASKSHEPWAALLLARIGAAKIAHETAVRAAVGAPGGPR